MSGQHNMQHCSVASVPFGHEKPKPMRRSVIISAKSPTLTMYHIELYT